jgi:branched-chain amino acid transport system permease protein
VTFAAYQPLLDFFLLSLGFAYSQQVVLRAGVFSIATPAFAALGGYCSAILVQRYGAPAVPSVALALVIGAATGFLISIPLARLRGVFQAIATLALVQIVVSLAYYLEPLTGGATGIHNIPKLVNTWHLLGVVAVVIWFMFVLSRSGVGRAFDVLRQDEMVGATLGVSIAKYHALAFVISGALGGLFGGLQSLYVFTIEPEMFGFGFLTAVLTYIILGGARSVLGPIVGTAVMIALPEISRPLAEHRQFVQGAILMAMIVFLPHGLVDGLQVAWRQRQARLQDKEDREKRRAHAVAGT